MFSFKLNSFSSVVILQERELEKRSFKQKALSQFDEFYGSLYQDQWPSVRLALLSVEKKGVVINNFSDKERVSQEMLLRGAFNVREIFNARKEDLRKTSADVENKPTGSIYQVDGRIEEALFRQQESDLSDIYPEPVSPETVDKITESLANQRSHQRIEDDDGESVADDPTKDQSLAEALKSADYDTSRLITPGPSGFALTASLYDFVPATKLKGMDDYIPESAHFRYYTDAPEAEVEIEAEAEFDFPDLLDVYAYERGNCDTFEYSKRGSTDLFDYHIINLASLAPVLALGIKKGEIVLDMTSSSLDTAILIGQTLMPGIFIVNAGSLSRGKYLLRHLDSYLFEDKSNVIVTDYHPLDIQDAGKFEKIIVYAPSTFDRRAVNSEEQNVFNPARVKERIRLPEVQTAYLKKALELVKVGGSVVYCTETLSPIQNDAVVQKVLDDLWFSSQMKFIVKDCSKGLDPLQSFMKIIRTGKFGHLVVPFIPNNCGPLYFTKLVKCAKADPETPDAGVKSPE
ncbi:hypothetical protein ONE63_002390 [Megalurothrips usitatus]|uniref:NOL1/NOP2/Sun domain family member 4 n=1 Tax=Megalurothrips usitatus TaxID=439358 RepID=A0AAV7XBU8_9NEOP|nr:hypothetical protein ONE63_002390 [Megalurothrips usitatus]